MKKLLIVDDELGLRSLLSSLFSEEYEVYLAEDGEQALDIVKGNRVDLILLDMRLKRMDGLEILENIRKYDEEVKVFILTAFTDSKKVDRLHELRIEGILQKPFDIFELKEKVDSVLV
ncbi:response regulator [Tepidibacter formicigenes]|jgi:two-component system response regulator (stage 0 sporulation protein F)|uniref:Stage 0 sporulation protein A homolog n=1 Tax=Tepidibacter formicigenes DSM 15518 TaxID=1123349 RepID=A0A1M6S0Z4_9FIRM|nr:response regulator [Tepidibacter formicigenes]SHK38411.1 two-component system, response regulator, stage 0 sporulation protein F [Tepidibacter formicigenes DSM 15518]